MSANLSRESGSSFLNMKLHALELSLHELSIDILGHDVCTILSAGHFKELEVTGAESILNPKIGNCKVADAAKAAPPADADRCSGVRINAKLNIQA